MSHKYVILLWFEKVTVNMAKKKEANMKLLKLILMKLRGVAKNIFKGSEKIKEIGYLGDNFPVFNNGTVY